MEGVRQARRWDEASILGQHDLHANHPSSSSLLLGAGNGAPGVSCVGSCTYPPRPNGLKEDSFDRIGMDELVLAWASGVLRDHPNEFIESRKVVEVILSRSAARPTLARLRSIRASLFSLLSWNGPALIWKLCQLKPLSKLGE